MSGAERSEAAAAVAAAEVACAIEAFNLVDLCGNVADLIAAFAENDGKLIRAAGLLALGAEDGGVEAIALLAEVRESIEWSIRRPLSKAGVMAPDAKPVRT